MASPLPNVPRVPSTWTPAGYLPAPKPARFISEAERAAEALPPSIKAQSLRNALLKGGAKPVELEYAGLDKFLADQAGPVRREDVLDFLKREGPLGQLKRVEQTSEPEGLPITQDQEEGSWSPDPSDRGPAYATDFARPFDPASAGGQAMYERYTVPGQQGDFTGYREVLIEDPKNRAGGKTLLADQRSPLADFPDADGWMQRATEQMRRLEGGDFVDWDTAARESERLIAMAEDRGMRLVYDNGTPRFEFKTNSGPVNAHNADYWARYNEYPDRIAVQNIQSDVGQRFSKADDSEMAGANRRLEELYDIKERLNALPEDDPDKADGLIEVQESIDNVLEMHDTEFRIARGPRGPVFVESSRVPQSTIAQDDNWKNLMARHIALQSIAGGGKPTTIPTGKQMVDVEGFGGHTHDLTTPEGRAAAESSGTAYNEDLVRRLQKIFRGLDPSGARVSAASVDGPIVTSIDPETARIQQRAFFNGHLHRLLGLPNSRTPGDNAIYRALSSGDTRRVERAVEDYGRGGAGPEHIDAAMRAIQYSRLMDELGGAGVSDLPNTSAGDADAPGWTIKPSPKAVRNALEKGLPIMSLLPLLLSPSQDKR